jgi:phage terminase small subunit
MALDRETVIRELRAAVEVARTKGDASAMIAGWREIGRMLGFYEPEVRRMVASQQVV